MNTIKSAQTYRITQSYKSCVQSHYFIVVSGPWYRCKSNRHVLLDSTPCTLVKIAWMEGKSNRARSKSTSVRRQNDIVATVIYLPYVNPLAPNDIYIYIYIYIYMSYRTANLQTLHFKYLLNKYTC